MREITKLIVSALLTMTIELIVLHLEKVKTNKLFLSLLINLLTNLILNSTLAFINNYVIFIIVTIIGEILVFLIEWFFYHLIEPDKKNYLYSLSANLTSFFIGSILASILFLFL